MSKFMLSALLIVASFGLVACGGGEKKKDDAPMEEAEMIKEVKRYWNLQQPIDGTPQLYCWYTHVKRNDAGEAMFSQAEATMDQGGQCDWNALSNKAGEPAKALPAENNKAMERVVEGVEFTEGAAGSKYNCAALEVTTNKRTFTAYDCELKDRANAPYKNPLAKEASASPEEGAWRLNQLLYMK